MLRHSDPPQSKSVSLPSVKPFAHTTAACSAELSARHRPVELSHLPVAQSASIPHALPIPQRCQHTSPPQSTAVSAPSLTPLTQDVHVPFSHWPLPQSEPCAQVLLSLHGVQTPPPQSMSAS